MVMKFEVVVRQEIPALGHVATVYLAVFDTRAEAKAYIAAQPAGDYRIYEVRNV